MADLESAFSMRPEPAEIQPPVDDGAQLRKKRGRPPGQKNRQPESRKDTKHIGGQFRVEVSTELQMICAEREKANGEKCTIQQLVGEGLNHVLTKAGRSPIAW